MKAFDHSNRFLNIMILPVIALALSHISIVPSISYPLDQQHLQNISQKRLLKDRQDIIKSEYNITLQGKTAIQGVSGAWQATNRNNKLRACFSDEGIRLEPISSKDHSWTWGISLVSYGMDGLTRTIAHVAPEANKNRITYKRGFLNEWYVNGEDGIEQGFTLLCPPTDSFPSPGIIIIGMKINGNLKGSINDSKDALEFKTTKGITAIRMARLKVFDAKGRRLSASYSLNDKSLNMFIDASGASYPITVDPVIDSPDWSMESNRAYANLGYSVATAGDVNGDGYPDVIVSAPAYNYGNENDSRAFVFYGSHSGLDSTADWTMDTADINYVSSIGDINGDGYSDFMISTIDRTGFIDEPGKILVFHGSSAGPNNTAAWSLEISEAYNDFDYSVNPAGDVNGDGYSDLVIGCPEYNNGENSEGQIQVYYGSSAGLSSEADWVKESDRINTLLGISVSTAGDVNGDGYADIMACSVTSTSNPGKVHVYYGSESGLSDTANWTVEGIGYYNTNGPLGYYAGDVNGDGCSDIIVENNLTNGLVSYYIYCGSSSGLGSASSNFLTSKYKEIIYWNIAAAGDVNSDGYADIIVTASNDYSYNEKGESIYLKAAILIYLGSASGPSTGEADWTIEIERENYGPIGPVSRAGDVNGDGYSEIIIGDWNYSNNETSEGRVLLYDTLSENDNVDNDNGSDGGCFLETAAGGSASEQRGQNKQDINDDRG